LEEKLFSAQKDSSLKASGIDSLKSKITELERMKDELSLKVSELDCLKSETISKPIVGGDDEKNMTKSDDISAVIEPSKNLSKYFVRGKSMNQAEKIDNDIATQTVIFDNCSANNEFTEPPKIDTEINPKISDETSISEINKDNMPVSSINPDIHPIISENMTPHLAQRENNMSSLIESNSQIPIGGIGTIPIVASTLMSPLSAYIFLVLLIIAVMWFVRHTWGFERKSERLRDMWIVG